MQGVAVAPGNTNFNREDWVQVTDSSILYPVYPWEGKCIEGASIAKKGDKLYMFYAGAYNNAPQQIGVAESEDGIVWKRLSEEPFLKNGKPGEWNSSESGHPHILPIWTVELICSIREITITENLVYHTGRGDLEKWKTFSERKVKNDHKRGCVSKCMRVCQNCPVPVLDAGSH